MLVGEEPHLPYDRPPLSKQYMAGKWGLDRVRLRADDRIEALELDLRLGHTATAIDPVSHRVELDDGEQIAYDGALIATGAHPKRMAGTEGMDNVCVLRTIEDSDAIARAVGPGTRVVVVGAGFIGSEVAATCHGLGASVVVVEALPTPLSGVLGVEMGEACALLHEDQGVELRTGLGVARIEASGNEVADLTEVVLEDGTTLPADVVVVGIGVTPTTGWLEGSGLEVRDGLVADSMLFAAQDVVVAGDVCRWADRRIGSEIRIEHWTNAAEQGMSAARNLLAGRESAMPFEPVPYFWSDQYDTKIQVIGHPHPDDEVVVVDGSVAERKFVALYGRDGMLGAALGFSRPRQMMGYRRLLEDRASFDEALKQ